MASVLPGHDLSGIAIDDRAGAATTSPPDERDEGFALDRATISIPEVPLGSGALAASGDAAEHQAKQISERADVAEALTVGESARSDGPVQVAARSWLGMDTQPVQLHADERADRLARSFNARAFTVGHDIYFRREELAPATERGGVLLAHEFVHVAQQSKPGATPTLMRQVALPSMDQVNAEIESLRRRLTEIISSEATEHASSGERASIERRLRVLEEVAGSSHAEQRKILLLREEIRQLREQRKAAPPSSELEQVDAKVAEHERELVRALTANIARIEREAAELFGSGDWSPSTWQQLRATEAELRANEAEVATLERIFTPQRAQAVAQIYKKEVRPDMSGHCMGAVYKGMEAVYSPKVSADTKAQVIKDSQKILRQTGEDTNSVDRIMETLRAHSRAGSPLTVKYVQRRRRWEPSVEEGVLSMVNPDYPGWYFFGLSVSGGYHSVLLAVDNTDGSPKIYWLDQYSKGFKKEVTNKLDKSMREDWLEPSYGFSDSKIWPLIPTPEAVVEIP